MAWYVWLAKEYVSDGMTAYVKLQEKEFADADKGYTFVSHQQEVGTGYFDAVNNCVQEQGKQLQLLKARQEEEQF